ncbi:MAG TPA: sodium:solute symporter family protein, partial [Clostridiales bacterium]|nr:sodium:solute symporter family protein [Clostridiales bacterium]
EVTKVTRIAIVVLSVIAMAIAAFLPPILSAINWLFAWLVPVFWLVVFGLFWKRSAKTAIATLLASWIINSLWSFTPLPAAINMADIPNGYVTLVVTFVVAVIMNLGGGGKPAYFKSEEYLLTKKAV